MEPDKGEEVAKKKLSKKALKLRTLRVQVGRTAAEHQFFDLGAADPGWLARGLARAASQLTAKRARWLKVRNAQIAKQK